MASEGATISRSWKISRMRGEEPKTPEKSNTLFPRSLRQPLYDPVTAAGRGDQNIALQRPHIPGQVQQPPGGVSPHPRGQLPAGNDPDLISGQMQRGQFLVEREVP